MSSVYKIQTSITTYMYIQPEKGWKIHIFLIFPSSLSLRARASCEKFPVFPEKEQMCLNPLKVTSHAMAVDILGALGEKWGTHPV